MTETENEEVVEDQLPFEHHPIPLWASSADEMRRAWLIEMFADADIAGEVLVRNMATVERWLKTGEVPDYNSKKALRQL